jgi:hypothetical protein
VLLWMSDACGQYRRGSGRGYGRRDEDRRESSAKDHRSSARGDQKYYRFKTPHERLPKGIPDWFIEKDANRDGQIMMAEFATRWNNALVAEFLQFDRNGDGIVTPKECLAAREAGVVYSGKGVATAPAVKPTPDRESSAISRDSREPDRSVASPATQSRAAARPPAETADKPVDETPPAADDVEIPASTLKYAISYIGMYDTDGNGALTKDEWEKMRKSPKAADRNGDGRVTPHEYALSITKR